MATLFDFSHSNIYPIRHNIFILVKEILYL